MTEQIKILVAGIWNDAHVEILKIWAVWLEWTSLFKFSVGEGAVNYLLVFVTFQVNENVNILIQVQQVEILKDGR